MIPRIAVTQGLDQLAELFCATAHLADREDGQIRRGFHRLPDASTHNSEKREDGQSLHIRRQFWEMHHVLLTHFGRSRVPTVSALS